MRDQKKSDVKLHYRATAEQNCPRFVDGQAHVVGLPHTAFEKFREKTKRDLTYREARFVAAEYLRERLEEEDLRPLYDVAHDDVLRLIDQTGIR